MTDEVALTGAELRDLRKNPVARAIADRLVFKAGSRFGLPVEDDPQTSEILTKVLFLAEDSRIQDPAILEQIR